LRKVVFPLEFPDNNDTVMYPFFRHLDKTGERGKLLRILHYGDSQIENNRISSTLRNRFQARFGGSGIGMFPVVSPVPHNASIQVQTYRPVGTIIPLWTGKAVLLLTTAMVC
jgi:hypothetical protein